MEMVNGKLKWIVMDMMDVCVGCQHLGMSGIPIAHVVQVGEASADITDRGERSLFTNLRFGAAEATPSPSPFNPARLAD
jgi:hypothetical protein